MIRILRFFFRNPDHYAPDVLPDFPLRCQHCDNLIRLATGYAAERVTVSGYGGPLFRDEGGHICCDLDHRILHKLMPSVLG